MKCACDIFITDARRRTHCHYCGLPKPDKKPAPLPPSSGAAKSLGQVGFEAWACQQNMHGEWINTGQQWGSLPSAAQARLEFVAQAVASAARKEKDEEIVELKRKVRIGQDLITTLRCEAEDKDAEIQNLTLRAQTAETMVKKLLAEVERNEK